METVLGAALALLSLMAAGAFTWLRSSLAELDETVQALRQRVSELELGGMRGMGALELKITEHMGAIRETLVRILSRLDHLESAQNDDRASRAAGRG